jgi:hypothetical protein
MARTGTSSKSKEEKIALLFEPLSFLKSLLELANFHFFNGLLEVDLNGKSTCSGLLKRKTELT